MATAGFCVDSDFEQTVLIRGWGTKADGDTGDYVIPISDVYRPVEVIQDVDETADWISFAVLRLDRPVPLTPLTLSETTASLTRDTPVICAGHSVGLPVKIHDDAVIRDTRPNVGDYFVTNLDTFAGVAGGPVLNADTLEVIGILVRGEVDFMMSGTAYETNVYGVDQGDGEEATFIDHVLPYLQRAAEPTATEMLAQLVDEVQTLNLQQGIFSALDAKLTNAVKAIDDVNDNNDVAAINKLEAFINEVEAQSDQKISSESANQLIATALRTIDLLENG